MKKIKVYGGILFFLTVVFFIFYTTRTAWIDQEKKDLIVEVFTEKDTYADGEWIPYSVIIENPTSESIFYKVTSCNVEITGNNGFHVKTDIGAEFGTFQLSLYELKSGEKVKRNMEGYNEYDLVYALGLKEDWRLKGDNSFHSRLYCDWGTGLCLPAGEYVFTAEFVYYDSEEEESEKEEIEENTENEEDVVGMENRENRRDGQHTAIGKKKITVTEAESAPIEESYIMDGQMVFYARTDKSVYKEGEKIRTWAKIESIDGQWFCWYWPNQISVGINFINIDTGKEIDIYNRIFLPFPEGTEYKETLFMEPSDIDSRGRLMRKLYKEGNYILEYVLWYYSFEKEEEIRVTIELPITIIPDESGIEFYNSPYPLHVFEEIEA